MSTIIEISDEEGTASEEPPTKSRRLVDNLKKQRWPTKQNTSTAQDQAKRKKNKRNATQNIEEDAAEVDVVEHTEHTEHTSPPATSGRSSFWERRRVLNIHELLAETENIPSTAARNIVDLLENENTIPFICRYRRDLIDQITPDRLRDIRNSYTEIVNMRKKAETIVAQLEKDNSITEDIRNELMCAKTSEELDYLYAPYKPANKGSLADRAKSLGLEVYAQRILDGEAPPVKPSRIIDHNNNELNTEEKVLNGICHIISHNISKNTVVLEELRRLEKVHNIILKCSKSKVNSTEKSMQNTSNGKTKKCKANDASKFELYHTFQCDVRRIKAYQILAINRGEKLKFLTVKIVVNDYLKHDMKLFIRNLYMKHGIHYKLRTDIFERSFEECYTKKLCPFLSRQVRANLKETSRKAAIAVFANNLKQLLLMSPLKGQRILGIDPGFANGCKLALISESADVLEIDVIYPHSRGSNPEKCGEVLAKMLIRHNCKVIALGNGTACRETEQWLSKLFVQGILDTQSVHYSIVSEQGASIYSCSEVARKEFPGMDVNQISAVSIARRLNDPLSEYVKIDPQHIGVGMYQHDINEKALTESLNDVVSECVSFVGVDINTASLSVLKHIAGLSEKKAEKIIAYRSSSGPFHERKDLLKVKSIGEKTYLQCSGFLRIEPGSIGGKVNNLLDCTWVHPESYVVAKKIISNCKLQLKDIGTESFTAKIKSYNVHNRTNDLSKEFKMPTERLEFVLNALQRKLLQDYRADFDKRPLFKQGLTRITDLSIGDIVTGAVNNVTDFGAFVDIGVEYNALIHVSKLKHTKLDIGDRVTAVIEQLDIRRKRIGLRLKQTLTEDLTLT